MRKYLLNTTMVFLITLSPLLSVFSHSATIFSDDFDSHPDTCHTGGTVPAGWDHWGPTTASTTKDSITHYAGEISSGGRNGAGKSLKMWRHSNFTATGEFSGLYGVRLSHGNIFIRYYQKLPSPLDLTFTGSNGNYLKFWRLFTTGTTDIYLDATAPDNANMRTGGGLIICDDEGAINTNVIAAGDLVTTIWDGNWHCLEFQIGLNNRTLRFWLDGNLRYENTSFNWDKNRDQTITGLGHFGFGNYSSNYTWQSSWQAAEFDDVVISTTYVGPGDFVPSPDPTPSPSTSSSSGGGGCFIATAAFGSVAEPAVRILREFRDKILMANDLGSSLVSYYERTSPPIADFIRRHDSAKYLVRICLLLLAGLCWLSLAIGPFNTLILGIFLVALIAKRRTVLNVLRSSI